jgi:hypothetical protein
LDERVTVLHVGHVLGPNVHPIIAFYIELHNFEMIDHRLRSFKEEYSK